MWKGASINKHKVLHECLKCLKQQYAILPLIYLNSSMLPLHLTNGCLLTDRSNLPFPCLGLCKSLMWLGWEMPGERRGCLARDKFATSWTHSPQQPPVQATVTPGKPRRVAILKPLVWLVNFDQPFVLNIGRWLIKNIMLMGYILGGLFQTWNSALPASQIVVLTQMRQRGKGGAEEGIPQADFASEEDVGRSTASVHGLCAWGLSRKDCKASKWLSWLVPKHIKVKEIKFLWCVFTFWKT